MNQRAKLRIESPAAPANAPLTETENVARPKVLRRPAQFSQPATPAHPKLQPPIDIRLDAPARDTPTAAAPIAQRNWQDDGRFAVALLAIIIMVNVIVGVWLTRMAPAEAPVTPATTSTANDPAASEGVSLIDALSEAGKTALEP